MDINNEINQNTEVVLQPVEQPVTNTTTQEIVNDVSIKVKELGPEGKKQIIVNGIDITNLPVTELTEELADQMTDEQAEEYIKGFNEEEIELFREVYGFVITAPKMSEEELKEREENRTNITGSISNVSANGGVSQESAPVETTPQKTEQTGSVIFGVRN